MGARPGARQGGFESRIEHLTGTRFSATASKISQAPLSSSKAIETGSRLGAGKIPCATSATPLYPHVQHHLETFLAEASAADPDGDGTPQWVEDDFRAYLRCGILAHGFARIRCDACAAERLVAFSRPLVRAALRTACAAPWTVRDMVIPPCTPRCDLEMAPTETVESAFPCTTEPLTMHRVITAPFSQLNATAGKR
jgi:hypothetical protein